MTTGYSCVVRARSLGPWSRSTSDKLLPMEYSAEEANPLQTSAAILKYRNYLYELPLVSFPENTTPVNFVVFDVFALDGKSKCGVSLLRSAWVISSESTHAYIIHYLFLKVDLVCFVNNTLAISGRSLWMVVLKSHVQSESTCTVKTV